MYKVMVDNKTLVCLLFINLLGGAILPRFLFQNRYVSGAAC